GRVLSTSSSDRRLLKNKQLNEFLHPSAVCVLGLFFLYFNIQFSMNKLDEQSRQWSLAGSNR
ncbi:hypothetical protein ABQD61_13075, partial [Enterococcus asini]|uniref:hypothetical protein n=1 Tax=Enterococcus asini TaxID=57732 RepID=UPI0032E3B3DB